MSHETRTRLKANDRLEALQIDEIMARVQYESAVLMWVGRGPVAESMIHYAQRIDFKIQPDTWFVDRDKLLLAVPNGNVRVRWWQMYTRDKEATDNG